jgi:hypothetical protein
MVAQRDWRSHRTPLSGENSRHGGGDVILPAESPYLVECKLRAAFVHHTLFAAAKKDAAKHGKQHAILYTKRKREHGWLVTIDGELFSKLLEAANAE